MALIQFLKADKLLKNLNLFYFFRRNIISQNFKLFNDSLKRLKEETKKGNSIPEKCKKKTFGIVQSIIKH